MCGSFHCGVAHKPISIQEAVKIPEAKAAMDREWIHGKTVHFVNFTDFCHLKHAELTTLQKYKRRVVSPEHNVKEEEGHRGVFAQQGASASRMAAAMFLDTTSKLPGVAGETCDAI